MPRATPLPRTLTLAEARRLWLAAQRLDRAAPFGAGPAATRAAVEHLGYVQIDTISVIERSHHHILWSRIPEYRLADLAVALSGEKSVFEYWTHALAYIPTRDYRYFMADMKRHRETPEGWFALGQPEGPAGGAGAGAARGGAEHPRHRRRRAGREGPSVGEPQAVEAGAAARLLSRRPDGLGAVGHGEELRADRPAFRLAAAAPGGDARGSSSTTCSTGRCARRGSCSIDAIQQVRGRRAGDGGADRRAGAAQAAGAGGGARGGGVLGRARGPRCRRSRTRRWCICCRPSIRW